MGQYLLLWEIDRSYVPLDQAERTAGWEFLLGIVKEDLEKGVIKSWGMYAGEWKGYSVAEGNDEDIHRAMVPYAPIIKFEVHPFLSRDQVESINRSPAR